MGKQNRTEMLTRRSTNGKTKLGWIQTETKPLYLHAGGAIGADGAIYDVKGEARGLEDYILPPPPDGQELRAAIESRFRVRELGQSPGAKIAAAVLQALPARAVLGPTNYTVHFGGITGSLETSCAAVALGSFRVVPPPGMETLTTTWSSPIRAIQRMVHEGGDSLIGLGGLTNKSVLGRVKEFISAQDRPQGDPSFCRA